MKYIVTGGGTGGHIYPALAIADEIKKRDKGAEILYIGTENSLESKLVPKAGYSFKTVRVRGLPRKINKEALGAAKELCLGLRDAKKIIKDFNPDIVIGTGGFVSGPIVYMATRMKIPTCIHEQNVFPGITNKILSRFVDLVLVTFEESRKYFKKKSHIRCTGNPIREDIIKFKEAPKGEFKDYKKIILSFGGSGGQKKLNDSILEIIDKGLLNQDYKLIHITGNRFYETSMGYLDEKNIKLPKNIDVIPYLYDMPRYLNLSDLIITSAGAITLAEISAIGIPSILIPKAYTAENHQEYNAREFESAGASILILERDLRGDLLNEKINGILSDEGKIQGMKKASRSLGNLRATENIVTEIGHIIK